MTSLIPYLLLAALGLGAFWAFHQKTRNQKKVIGHVYPTFYTSTGAEYRALCKVEGNNVEAPLPSLERHPTIKSYLISSIKAFNSQYPPGWPKFFQAEVPTTTYYEGDPNPIVSRDPNDRNVPLLTSELLVDLRNDPSGEMLTKAGKEWTREGIKKAQSPSLLYILIGVGVIISIVVLVQVVNLSSGFESLSRLWGI